jgi:hypothetical protein
MNKKLLAAVMAVGIGVAGCTVVNTAPDEVALHYSGGSLSSQTFENCVTSGVREVDGPGDFHYYYPQGQRDFKFSTDEGSDFGPLTSSTNDSVELVVKGIVTFTVNTSCDKFTDSDGREWPGGKLQKFHETLGKKSHVPGVDDNGVGDGWKAFLGKYVKDVVDRTVDLESSKLSYSGLYNDASVRAKWEESVVGSIASQVEGLMGSDYVKINKVVLQKPDLPESLKNELVNAEAARLRGSTANIDQENAKKFGSMEAYIEYQSKVTVNKAIAEGKVQVLPVPYGSPVIVGGR